MSEPWLARRILRGFAGLALLGVLGLGVLLGSLWLERRFELTLPTPTGSFAVGRAVYDWTDDANLDTLAAKRELLVWIWYPSTAGQSSAMDDYVPAQMRAAAGPLGGGALRFRTRGLAEVAGHSTRNSDVSAQQRSYPVVIMIRETSPVALTYTP